MMTMDIATQIFMILKQPDRKYLTQVGLDAFYSLLTTYSIILFRLVKFYV